MLLLSRYTCGFSPHCFLAVKGKQNKTLVWPVYGMRPSRCVRAPWYCSSSSGGRWVRRTWRTAWASRQFLALVFHTAQKRMRDSDKVKTRQSLESGQRPGLRGVKWDNIFLTISQTTYPLHWWYPKRGTDPPKRTHWCCHGANIFKYLSHIIALYFFKSILFVELRIAAGRSYSVLNPAVICLHEGRTMVQ